MDLLKQIEELQNFYNEQQKLNELYRAQFKLAGYEINDASGNERSLEVLINEALGSPPPDPGRWIRIIDIPKYISEYLILPSREDLEYFNDKSENTKPNLSKPEIKTTDEEPMFVNDEGEPETYTLTGNEWKTASQVPDNTTVVDEMGVIWHRIANNQFVDVASFDESAPDYERNVYVSQFPPLREIKYDE